MKEAAHRGGLTLLTSTSHASNSQLMPYSVFYDLEPVGQIIRGGNVGAFGLRQTNYASVIASRAA
jgi:hypothetical protein